MPPSSNQFIQSNALNTTRPRQHDASRRELEGTGKNK
jgi:hypothetical protein